MQIVIDVSENIIKHIEDGTFEARPYDRYTLIVAVLKGTLLPKGHGRLIDADKTLATAWTNFYNHEDVWEKKDKDYLPFGRMYDQNGFECCQQTIVNAPTIIEADKER